MRGNPIHNVVLGSYGIVFRSSLLALLAKNSFRSTFGRSACRELLKKIDFSFAISENIRIFAPNT